MRPPGPPPAPDLPDPFRPVRRHRRPLRVPPVPSWLGALLEFLLLVWVGVEILVGDLERATLAAVLLIMGRTYGPGKGSPPDDPENPR